MTIWIGIDVHKKKCVATLKRDSQEIVEQTSFYNNGHGIKEFIEDIKLYSESAIAVCESTGNYWIRLHDTLEDNGIDTVLADPIKTKIPWIDVYFHMLYQWIFLSEPEYNYMVGLFVKLRGNKLIGK